MRRRALLSSATVVLGAIAGCAAEPIEEQNESEIEEGGEPGGEVAEEENAARDDAEDDVEDADDADWVSASEADAASHGSEDEGGDEDGDEADGADETDATDEADDTLEDEDGTDDPDETDVAHDTAETDSPADGDDPMVDDPADVDDGDDSGDDGPPEGDDPMVDDEPREDGDADATEDPEADGIDDLEEATLTIGVVGPGGERIEGAQVAGEHAAEGTSGTFEGETGDDGIHTADVLEGPYTITVDHPAYEERTVEYVHDGDREIAIELEAGEDTPGVAGVRFVVTDVDGEAIEGASVRGEGAPLEADVPLTFSGETDDAGEYTDRLYENEYVVDLDHSEYEARTIEYDHDGPTELVVELGPA